MTGIFGPQNANAAITLPGGSDKQRYGAQQTWVKDCSGPGRNDGTVLDGAFYNRIIGNLDYLVSQSGVTAVPGDFTVVYRAVLGAVAAGAPAVLNSIKELADALGDDPNYAATVLQSLSFRVRVDAAQYFTAPQKAQAVVNLGLSAVSVSGAYADLTGLPTLGTAASKNVGTAAGNVVQLNATTGKLPAVDGSLLTNVTVTWTNVSGKPAFAAVATSGSYTDLTSLPALGTAASKNVGTAAGNVVQLDVTTGKLPAVDGSQLTNIVASSSGAVIYNASQSLTDAQKLQAIANLGIPFHCGRLLYSNTTTLAYKPYKGDLLKINGQAYRIPTLGIVGLFNSGVYVNGTAGQNLAASTIYYVYVFNNAGTLTADFSTTGHTTSSTAGNIGTEIKSSDDSRSLIGMVWMDASGLFSDTNSFCGVLTWFNRRRRVLHRSGFSISGTTVAGSTELTATYRTQFIIWGDDSDIDVHATSDVSTSGTANVFFGITVDGATYDSYVQPYINTANHASAGAVAAVTLSEGTHFVGFLGGTNGSPASYTNLAMNVSLMG